MTGDAAGGGGGDEVRLDGRTVFEGRLLRVVVDRVRLPGGGRSEREVVRHPGAAAVLPLLERPGGEEEVLLVRQFRYAPGEPLWEVPAGTIEPGESPEACARRELREEAGLRAEGLRHLATVYTSPGFTDERVHLFLARDPEPGEPDPEEGEELERRRFPLRRAVEMVRRGEVRDGKTVAALLMAGGLQGME